jgi:hypothetical protein
MAAIARRVTDKRVLGLPAAPLFKTLYRILSCTHARTSAVVREGREGGYGRRCGKAYVVFDFHGKDLSVELDLGSLPLPQSTLIAAAESRKVAAAK